MKGPWQTNHIWERADMITPLLHLSCASAVEWHECCVVHLMLARGVVDGFLVDGVLFGMRSVI